jgi:CubicO group peptidase (beta-lactamase class C family)
MLGMIAERVTGTPLEEALRARFFGPLALTSLRRCASHPGDARGEARGHVRTAQGSVPHPPENFHLFVGAGGLCGSALDVARWTRALATGKVVTASSYARMSSPIRLADGRTADYGMAMALVSPDGPRRLGHGGYGGGFSAQAAYYPDAGVTVVVMLNRFVLAEALERPIARRLLGLPAATLREVAQSGDDRSRYVGSYDIGVLGWYPKVVERDGKLWFELAPLPPQPLAFVGDDEFVREGQPYGYRLAFGPDGPAREVRILGMGLMTWYGRRR